MVKKKIYFAAPIKGDSKFNEILPLIMEELKKYFEVLSEHLNWGNPYPQALSSQEIYKRDIDILNIAEAFFAEVSAPSHGVGLEIAYAIWERKIPVYLFIHSSRAKSLSSMIAGNPHIPSDMICVYETFEDVKKYLQRNFENK